MQNSGAGRDSVRLARWIIRRGFDLQKTRHTALRDGDTPSARGKVNPALDMIHTGAILRDIFSSRENLIIPFQEKLIMRPGHVRGSVQGGNWRGRKDVSRLTPLEFLVVQFRFFIDNYSLSLFAFIGGWVSAWFVLFQFNLRNLLSLSGTIQITLEAN